MHKTALLLLTAGVLLGQTPPAKSTPKTAPPKTGGTTKSAASRPNPLLNPVRLRAKAPDLYRVKFTTTKGDFVVEVNRSWAPLGADRFWNLVRNRFFNDAAFFRYLPNFIVQFGIPASPAINAAWEKAIIPDDPVTQSNKKGTITFATAGPKTRTTQVFINLGDNSRLDRDGFAPFGTVTEGMDIVEGLYSGYGEAKDLGGTGPSTELVGKQGKAYLDKNFPKLDRIIATAVIFPEAPPPPPPASKKPAAPTTKKTPPPPPAKK